MHEWQSFLEQVDSAPRLRRDPRVDSRRFLTIVHALEDRLGCTFQYEVGEGLQDEVVYGSMLLPSNLLVEANTNYMAWLRASETDNLVTVWDWDGAVRPDQLALIISTVTELGLFYVPTSVLDMPYTGRAHPPRIPTWSERLFGYG
jgi:hypothetical protein